MTHQDCGVSPIETDVFRVPTLNEKQAKQWLTGDLTYIHPNRCNSDTERTDIVVQLCPPPNFGVGRLRDVGRQTFLSLKASEQVPFSD